MPPTLGGHNTRPHVSMRGTMHCTNRCSTDFPATTIATAHTGYFEQTDTCDSMDSWMSRRPVTLPAWNGNEPIQREMRRAFTAQSKIGWDQFLRGRIAKAWQKPIKRTTVPTSTARRILHTGTVDAKANICPMDILPYHVAPAMQ
jgi:hypothetical protein